MSKSMRRRGFTLIELLIVIVVIAILALIVIPKLMGASRKAKDSTLKGNLVTLRHAIEMFQADCGGYPSGTDLAGLSAQPAQYIPYGTTTAANLPANVWKGPYLSSQGGIGGGAIPRNPYIVSTDVAVANHWSYTAASGTITFPTPTGSDANNELYTTY